MRSAAAAAIVLVVAGGGWGVYSRVQRPQPARVIVLTPRAPAQGGFASSGAMRTPQTLNGPTVVHPATAHSATAAPQANKPGAKVAAKSNQAQVHRNKSVATNKAGVQPATPSAA